MPLLALEDLKDALRTVELRRNDPTQLGVSCEGHACEQVKSIKSKYAPSPRIEVSRAPDGRQGEDEDTVPLRVKSTVNYAAPFYLGNSSHRFWGDLDIGSFTLVLDAGVWTPGETKTAKDTGIVVPLRYGAGDAKYEAFKGRFWTETVKFGDDVAHGVGVAVVQGIKKATFIFNDALIGLSFIEQTLVEQGIKKGEIDHSKKGQAPNLLPSLAAQNENVFFALDLSAESGRLLLDHPPRELCEPLHWVNADAEEGWEVPTYLPLLKQSFPHTYIDSGSALIMISQKVFEELRSLWNLEKEDIADGIYTLFVSPTLDRSTCPDFTLNIGTKHNHRSITLTPETFWSESPSSDGKGYRSTIAAIDQVPDHFCLLGDAFFFDVLVAFDAKNKRVGFSQKSKCQK